MVRACLITDQATCSTRAFYNHAVGVRLNLTQDPIASLLRKIAIPASVGMFFNTMYYIVDNFYAGMLSSTALAGISLASPIFFMGLSIALGIGQGTNALVGHARGAGEQAEAERYAGHALSLAWIAALLAGFFIYLATPILFRLMHAEGEYTEDALKYLSIMLPTLGLMTHGMAANGILNSLGDTTSLRNSLVIAFYANILLDPLFIFVFDWGVYGLAAATAVTQLGSAIYLTYKVRQSQLGNCLNIVNLQPNGFYYRALLQQSIPASTNMFLIAIGSLIIISAVAQFGENAVAGLGIALRIEQLILLPALGLNIAVLSIVSVNFGAREFARMEKVALDSIKFGTSLMLLGGVVIFIFAESLIGLFTKNAAVITYGVSYLRVEAFILPAYVVSFIAGAVLQGMKRPLIPMYFNVLRQLILPLIFILIALGIFNLGIYGIWGSIAIATWLVASAQYFHMCKQFK